MHLYLILAAQAAERSMAGELGYAIGYAVGYFERLNFWTIVSIALVVLAAILYLIFFRSEMRSNRD